MGVPVFLYVIHVNQVFSSEGGSVFEPALIGTPLIDFPTALSFQDIASAMSFQRRQESTTSGNITDLQQQTRSCRSTYIERRGDKSQVDLSLQKFVIHVIYGLGKKMYITSWKKWAIIPGQREPVRMYRSEKRAP